MHDFHIGAYYIVTFWPHFTLSAMSANGQANSTRSCPQLAGCGGWPSPVSGHDVLIMLYFKSSRQVQPKAGANGRYVEAGYRCCRPMD